MRDPKFKLNDAVHVNGTSGIGKVIFVEFTGSRYIYTILYSEGKKKQAQETDLIKVN